MREIKDLTAEAAKKITENAQHLRETLYQDIWYAAQNGKDRITVAWENVNDDVIKSISEELITKGYHIEDNVNDFDARTNIFDICW